MKKNTAQNAEQPERNLEFSKFKNLTRMQYDLSRVADEIQEEIDNEFIMQVSATILNKGKKH